MNRLVALAVRIARRDRWTATVRTAQHEGSAGILPGLGAIAEAVAIWVARRAAAVRTRVALWAAEARVIVRRRREGSAAGYAHVLVGLWLLLVMLILAAGRRPASTTVAPQPPNVDARVGQPTIQGIEAVASALNSAGDEIARQFAPTFAAVNSAVLAGASEPIRRWHSDVMDRLAAGAYYASSTRRRFLA